MKALNDPQREQALVKAQGFELAWMRRKKEIHGRLSNAENKRIEMITERYNQTLKRLQERHV